MPGQRADDERFALDRDPAQFGEFADIDDHFRRNQPQIHRGDQALPARKHLRLLSMHGKQFQRIGNAGGARVGESRGFHSGKALPGPSFSAFEGIRGWDFSKVKLLDFAVFPTFGLAPSDLPTHAAANQEWFRGGADIMKLGFFTMPIHPLDKDWRQSLKEDREAFLLADELGFSEAYVGEHVTDRAENITSCVAFIAWLAAATKQIKLGTGTVNMPNSHPAAIAASIAMLDHMLDGRLIFGISPGGLLSDAELFRNLGADRNAMFLEAINQVLAIWDGKPPYHLAGKYWNISIEKALIEDIGQGFIAKPLQRPHPPIVVTAVAPFSKGVTEAAARGWEPISANFLMPAWVKSHWPKYVEG